MIQASVFFDTYARLLKTWQSGHLNFLKTNTSFSEFDPEFAQICLYSLNAGGKRIRPAITMHAAEMAGISNLDKSIGLATAVELLHTYSLIHDDLPALDDDKLRRSKPTLHIQYNEAKAILAGDALQALAFETLSAVTQQIETLRIFSKAVGGAGLAGGQFLDTSTQASSIEELEQIHNNKTGALFAACITMPFIEQQGSPAEILKIHQWSLELGLLFQIADDILDSTSSSDKLGKTPGKDFDQNKATYIKFYGLDKARTHARQQAEKLSQQAHKLFSAQSFFTFLPHYIVDREN